MQLSESATSRRSGQPSLDDLLTPNLHRRSAPPPCRTPLLPPYSYISRGTSVGSFTSEMSSDDSAYHTRSPLQGAFQGTRRSQDRMRPTHQVSRQSDADSPRTPSPTAPPLPLSPCTATYTSAAQLSTRRRALQPLLPTDQAVVSEHELVLRRAGSKRTADKHVVCRAIPVRRSFSDSGRNSPALGLKALDAMSTYGPADDTHDEVEVEMQVADNHKMNAVAQSDPAVLGGSPHTPRTSSYLQTTGADLGASPNLQTPDISPGVAHVRNFRMRTDATESPLCTLSEHPLYVTNYSIPSVHAVSVATSESVSAAGATDPAVQEMPIKSRPNFLYKPAQHSSVRHKQAGMHPPCTVSVRFLNDLLTAAPEYWITVSKNNVRKCNRFGALILYATVSEAVYPLICFPSAQLHCRVAFRVSDRWSSTNACWTCNSSTCVHAGFCIRGQHTEQSARINFTGRRARAIRPFSQSSAYSCSCSGWFYWHCT